jgi:hypothetical protein
MYPVDVCARGFARIVTYIAGDTSPRNSWVFPGSCNGKPNYWYWQSASSSVWKDSARDIHNSAGWFAEDNGPFSGCHRDVSTVSVWTRKRSQKPTFRIQKLERVEFRYGMSLMPRKSTGGVVEIELGDGSTEILHKIEDTLGLTSGSQKLESNFVLNEVPSSSLPPLILTLNPKP